MMNNFKKALRIVLKIKIMKTYTLRRKTCLAGLPADRHGRQAVRQVCLVAVLALFSISSYAQTVGVSQQSFTPTSLFHVHNTSTGQLFQLSNLNTTGANTPTSTSGFNIGIDASKNITFNQYEAANMSFYTNNSPVMAILSGGNVGIGTTSPDTKLDVDVTGAGVINAIELTNTYSGTSANHGAAIYFKGYYKQALISAFQNPVSVTGGDLQLQTYSDNNTLNTGIYLNRLGNVGIGTTSPSSKLTVYDDGENVTQTTFTQALTNAGIHVQTDYTADAYTSGVFWSAANNSPTKPKAGIYAQYSPSGSRLFFGTSNTYATGITNNAIVIDPSGYVGIGTASPSVALHVVGSICYTGSHGACSDARYKKDIIPLSDALTKMLKLQGVHYYWRTDEFPQQKFDSTLQIGLIAQEVEKIYPELVKTNADGYKTIDYSRLTPILIEAIKEQQKIIEKQQKTISSLESDNESVQKRMLRLEELISTEAKK